MDLSAKRITMFTVSLALFMDVLDSNIINTAIPVMAKNFQVNPVDLKIALISYLLSLAVFIPISGWTADRFGVKRVFIAALSLFTLSSFWCGYAHTLMDLIVGRSIQGIGGAFMISVGKLIIARTYERHQLVQAMNTVILVVSIAVMIGPFVGGVITEHWSWPWIFWVNIPAGIAAIILASIGLKDNTPRIIRPFDVLGFILFGGSLALLCFSLSRFSESHTDWYDNLFIIALAVSVFVYSLVHIKKHPHPVINIKLFRLRTFQISVIGNLCCRLGFGGIPFLLPLFQQISLGFSAQLSGLLLVPTAFGIIFSKLIAFKVLGWVGYRRYLIVNTIFLALILATFQLINELTPVYEIAVLTFIFGIITAAQYTGMNSLAFAEISAEDLSASTSITSTTQILAQTLGVAFSAILLRIYAVAGPRHGPLLTTQVFHHTFLTISVITLLSVVIFIRLESEDGQQMLIPQEKGA